MKLSLSKAATLVLLFLFTMLMILSALGNPAYKRPHVRLEEAEGDVDGAALTMALLDILDEIMRGNYTYALSLIDNARSSELPRHIAVRHRDLYNTLGNLTIGLSRLTSIVEAPDYYPPEEVKGSISMVYDVSKDLKDKLISYNRLLKDYTSSEYLYLTLRRELALRMDALIDESITPLITIARELTEIEGLDFNITIYPRRVAGGGEFTIIIDTRPEWGLCNATINVFYGYRYSRVYTLNFTDLGVLRIRAPNVTEALMHRLIGGGYASTFSVRINVFVLIRAVVDGSLRRGVKMGYLVAAYGRPPIMFDVPNVVRYGEPLVVNVSSYGRFNVTVVLDGRPIGSYMVEPGSSRITLQGNVSPGYHTLAFIVKSGERYISTSYSAAVAVVGRSVRLSVVVENPVVSLVNQMGLSVKVLDGPSTGRLRVSSDFGGVFESEFNGSFSGRVPVSYFPLPWVYHVNVSFIPDDPSYEPLSLSYEVIVINPAGLVLLLLLPLLLLSWYGPIDVLPELRRPRLRPRGLRGARRRVRVSRYVEFLRITLRPSILARIYYSAVKMLGLRLPLPSETLREHFSRVSQGGRLRNLLFRLMVLAERDLYSGKGAPKEEAERIVEELRSE